MPLPQNTPLTIARRLIENESPSAIQVGLSIFESRLTDEPKDIAALIKLANKHRELPAGDPKKGGFVPSQAVQILKLISEKNPGLLRIELADSFLRDMSGQEDALIKHRASLALVNRRRLPSETLAETCAPEHQETFRTLETMRAGGTLDTESVLRALSADDGAVINHAIEVVRARPAELLPAVIENTPACSGKEQWCYAACLSRCVNSPGAEAFHDDIARVLLTEGLENWSVFHLQSSLQSMPGLQGRPVIDRLTREAFDQPDRAELGPAIQQGLAAQAFFILCDRCPDKDRETIVQKGKDSGNDIIKDIASAAEGKRAAHDIRYSDRLAKQRLSKGLGEKTKH